MLKQFFKFLAFLYVTLSVSNIAFAETIYRYDVSHECDDSGICSWAIFFTLKDVLSNKNTIGCIYMALDPNNPSQLVELKAKDAVGPITTFIVNLDTPIECSCTVKKQATENNR